MDDRPTDPIAEVSQHIDKAKQELDDLEHPYGGDKVLPPWSDGDEPQGDGDADRS